MQRLELKIPPAVVAAVIAAAITLRGSALPSVDPSAMTEATNCGALSPRTSRNRETYSGDMISCFKLVGFGTGVMLVLMLLSFCLCFLFFHPENPES